jgi:polyhydroxyalkanoate synthesis repressor PhaR
VDNKAQETAAEDRPRRVIKRYSNRKLYDTKDSRYVTLLQIAEMVRGGEEVQIIDNNTKEDLTEVTLAQIIYEEQKQKAASSRNVPLQTLKDLIHQRTEKSSPIFGRGPSDALFRAVARASHPRPAAAGRTQWATRRRTAPLWRHRPRPLGSRASSSRPRKPGRIGRPESTSA